MPELDEPEFPLPPVPELFEFEELSAGLIICSSSSEPLEPSEQEVNGSARLRARTYVMNTRGGVKLEVDFHRFLLKMPDLTYQHFLI